LLTVEKMKEKERRQKAEVTLHVKGRDIFVEQANEDLYAAIDQLMDKLDRQVVRHKDRLQDHHHESPKRLAVLRSDDRFPGAIRAPGASGPPGPLFSFGQLCCCNAARFDASAHIPAQASCSGGIGCYDSRLRNTTPDVRPTVNGLRGKWLHESSRRHTAAQQRAGRCGRDQQEARLRAGGTAVREPARVARSIVTDNLFARERLGSTGLGHAVAIPHGRIKGLKNPLAAVLRVQHPIPFDAPDDESVSLLIFLLVPEAATQRHLEILSEIAEMLSDRELRERLKTEGDAQTVHKLISDWEPLKSVA
jgi:nitrogen PTS system EIIA component